MEERQREALKTVAAILRTHGILFQVSGGLAAIAYGSKRPLHDIDIDVDKKDVPKVRELFQEYIVEDFQKYQDEKMEIWLMTLKVNGVEVDISQAEEAYFKDTAGKRVRFDADLTKATVMEIEGVEVPVMDREELIQYKKVLSRTVDLEDIRQISRK